MILSGGAPVTDFAPQALGEVTPSLSNGYFYASDGLTLSGKFATYAALYRAQPSIATVVDKVANAAARLTLKVWDYSPAAGKVADSSSAFAQLIERPCPVMSPFNFWRWTFSTYEVYGEAFWLKVRDPDTQAVIGLLPMHPSRTMVKRSETGGVVYVFTLGVASAGLLEVPESEVVPFQRYNPDSLMRGMSRLEPLRSTLLNEDASRRATASWWRNGARPSVFLKHPGELSPGAHSRIREGIQQAHGGADNMGKAAVLEEGMEAQVVQLTADEMQYIESRKMNLQEVCMVFDVPPPVVHILDHATFSNITEQMRSMYRDTMAPRLEDVESTIDFHLRSEFYPTPSHRATFALDEVLRGDFETRAEAVQKLVNTGLMKPSEGRPLFDLPDAGPVADQLYGNAALVPLGSSVHGQEQVSPGGDVEPSTAPMGLPKPLTAASYRVRAITGRVGRKSSLPEKRDALVEEHRKALADVFDAQRDDAKADPQTDGKAWDEALAAVLLDLGVATAKTVGGAVGKSLGGTFDLGEIEAWLKENAITSARAINAATVAALKAALEAEGADPGTAVDQVFDGPVASRKESISASRVVMVAGLASLNAAGQNGAAKKTWVTGPSARSSHAEMNGETVGIHEPFSNGMNAPGDPSGGADEVAGCNCSLSFSS